MTINIMHLYYDLLNLYGESGNIKVLKKYFENQGIKTNIHFVTINDDINLENIDIIYIGNGTENNQLLALSHLKKYKKIIKDYIENNGIIISTGNSYEMFGKKIDKTLALNIFDYSTYNDNFRIVDEVLLESSFLKEKIIGFQNQEKIVKINNNHLFKVIKGTGDYPKSNFEGYKYKNFYGTHLIGPLLVRNPNLLEYICNNLIKEKKKNFKIKKIKNFQNKAYISFINKNFK